MTVKSTVDNSRNEDRCAIFAGTFNPFTVGHASIVERGRKLFDRIVIAAGVNVDKPDSQSDNNVAAIKELYKDDPSIEVVVWNGLMADLAKQAGARFFLRGVRNTTDFEYEKNMAEINRQLSGIETVILFTRPEHSAISSSTVRELKSYGVNVDNMLPKKTF